MKYLQLLLLTVILGLSSSMISCTTTSTGNQDDERANGISAGDQAMSRRSIYDTQDRVFRSLAY